MRIVAAVFLIIILLATACKMKPSKRYKPKYKEGDVVWLKPDSTKATIVDIRELCGCGSYDVSYFDHEHKAHSVTVKEFEIYSIVNQ